METNRIEYKRELTPDLDIEKEVISFLNYKEGGYIYIGIDNDGTIVGVEDADECMLRLKGRIKNNISPSAMGLFDIATETREGRTIEELMRIYRDLNIVESLGSGIPRILRAYGEDCFKFTENFIRITFPASVKVDYASGT